MNRSSHFPSPAHATNLRHGCPIRGLGCGLALLLTLTICSGATVLWRAANTTVHIGLPFTSLEFENPMTGVETVLTHPVLEWRDADYRAGQPPWYDDWTVSHPGQIDGNANEIWMRANGHSAWTRTTVPSTLISIHLNGDSNDGLAEVLVDGSVVARLDMYAAACCETALVIVHGLPATVHTVTVNAVGAGQGGGVDVAVLGAAALGNVFKWQQPPETITLGNVFNGWNEMSVTNFPPIIADDWVCTNSHPITRIRWWGSFLGWISAELPPGLPNAFQITIWSDVPANPAEPGSFSHPGVALWQVHCTKFKQPQFVGWDYDPRSGQYEACFLFEQDLEPQEWFYQQAGPTGTNIYWISIAAEYGPGGPEFFMWGWKTRPRDPMSPAPDDAVHIHAPPPWLIVPGTVCEGSDPIFWPDPQHSWDMAFELVSKFSSTDSKWEQWPDLSPMGMDVKDCTVPPPPVLLADDFPCTSSGPITNITIWGSYLHDQAPGNGSNVVFTLSIHDDIPAQQSPTGHSMPGRLLWMRQFQPGQFLVRRLATNLNEGWFFPPEMFEQPGDTICYQYDFPIPLPEAFVQEGSASAPRVYWLDCQAQVIVQPGQSEGQFGWKTCVTNWNDAAVWVYGVEPYQYPEMPPWNMLIWLEYRRLDLAFRINSGRQVVDEIKWSQPPVPATDMTNNFNGWNEISIHNYEQIVADDWVCTGDRPISDIHWWGSFLGWTYPMPPEMPDVLPTAFVFTIWTDVPALPNGGWSHPGQALWQFTTTNYAMAFAGWDWDPRQPGAPPEACFQFHVDIPPGQWFYQQPGTGSNVYWLSIAAQYGAYGTNWPGEWLWGWKTRPRDPASPAPDDAVWVWSPTSPKVGSQFGEGAPVEFPEGVSWDMAFELTAGPAPGGLDFGDAPDPTYPTLLANDGARHTIVPRVCLGNVVDAETDGQPNATATGDDGNPPAGPNDEDGVALFGSHLIPGGLTGVAVRASANGYLSAWVDFNTDGSWATPGDQIFTNVWVTNGLNNLYFTTPFAIPRATNTFARFRFSTAPITNFTGLAVDGEVEDYQWWIEPLDFGDAPDPLYPTTQASNGACHWLMQGVFLGALVDAEFDGQPNASATGDDLANQPDEDGVSLLTPLIPGQLAAVQVAASLSGAWLNAWVDFGADGSWATPGDQIILNASPMAGPNMYNFIVPANAAPGSNVFARFRFSTALGLSFTNVPGQVPNGEVEDHLWQIAKLDFGDAPDPTYPTLLGNNGARHVVGGLYLGAGVDAEADGQPDTTATGDDLAGTDDEDGVFFPTALIANAPAGILVVSSGTGLLQGWFDFDGDGTWTNTHEQPIRNLPVVAGTNYVQIFLPRFVANQGVARFRLSTQTNLTFTGLAPDGEVEDYHLRFYPLKWNQSPEQGPEGVDVFAGTPLADDFLCEQSGPITDFHIWGSFRNDILPRGGPGNMSITLTIYADVPAGPTPSHPGQVLWQRTFRPGQFTAARCMVNASEWWHDPNWQPPVWQPQADTNIYQFDFYVPIAEAFQQVSNTVYWLGVQYSPQPDGNQYLFGWKTSYLQWNDAACWFDISTGSWRSLFYGDGHPKANQPPPFNQVDFAFALSTERLDWGDAPDPTYPTLAANNGAAHVIVPGLMLGKTVDGEGDGQPTAIATGDDNNPPAGPNDEDGVIMPLMVPGQAMTLQVTVTGSGFLSGWVDFGVDGSWAQAGDQILTNVPLSTGVHTLSYVVPNNAVWGATTIARFRFSTVTNLTPTGLAPDGEVEDHVAYIHPVPVPDLGDAPDSSNNSGANMTAYPKGGPAGVLASYPTVYGGLMAVPPFGPIHLIPNGAAHLGRAFSGEMEADVLADQDLVNNIIPASDSPDLDGADDGLLPPVNLPHCGPGMIHLMFSWPGMPPWQQMILNVWCDWNRDGDWNDVLTCPDGTPVPEWAGQNIVVPPGVGIMPVMFHCWHPSLQKQSLWIRVTVSELATLPPLGSFSGVAAGDGPPPGFAFGETEDYYITDYDDQQAFDFGDAPSPYPTLLAANGARHLTVTGFKLGALMDAESDGLPHPLAQGDDLNNLADEDGVIFSTPILVNSQACVNVSLTGPLGGKLDAWLDFNGNGIWEAGEQIMAGTPLLPGGNPGLCFPVPLTAKLGTNFARFRLSSAGGLGPSGAAQDGEVEDYQVIIRQRRPSTNIIFTWITVTNTPASNQIVTVYWNAETNIHYEVLAAASMGTNGGTDIVWQVVSPIIIGPTNRFSQTNTLSLGQRYYRIRAPWTYP